MEGPRAVDKHTRLESPGSPPESPAWRTAFAFEARGVALHAVEGECRDAPGVPASEQALCAALHALRPGERVVLTYTGGGERDLGFRIAGETAAGGGAPAAPDDDLAARVRACLLPLDDAVRLVASGGAPAIEDFPMRAIGAPGCWCALPAPMGFNTGPAAAPEGVWLPGWAAAPTGLAEIDRLLRSRADEAAVRVAIERVEIDAAVRRALARLAARAGRPRRDAAETPAAEAAAVWAAAPCGLRLRVWAGSAAGLDGGTRDRIRAMAHGGAPYADDAAPGGRVLADLRGCVPWGHVVPRLLPAPAALLGEGKRGLYTPAPPRGAATGVRVGRTNDPGRPRPVRIAPGARARHVYAVGASGTGKSTLLAHMIRQDIANGDGVCVVDPHGELIARVLESYPEGRAADLVLVDAADPRRAAGINLLECGRGDRDTQVNFAVSEFLGIFRALYLDEHLGPVFELYLRNALLLLMDNELPPHTLLDLPRVFEDREFRAALRSWCRSPWVREFWEKTAERSSGDMGLANITAYIVSKVNAFLYSPALRAMVGQPRTTIDFDRILARRQVLLLNLAKGGLGGLDSRLLGMTLLSRLFGAALARGARPAGEPAFQVHVDEFHQFHTGSLSAMLSESRKFGLGFTLAHQNLGQISRGGGHNDLLESVLGNAGTLLFFRVGAPDAARLAAYTQPDIAARTLQYLPDHHVVARILTGGSPSRPFLFETDPPAPARPAPGLARLVRASRDRHSRPRGEIERALARRHAAPLAPRPDGGPKAGAGKGGGAPPGGKGGG